MDASKHSVPQPRKFKVGFCECFGCSVEAFPEALLRKSIHPPLRPLAWLVRSLSPNYFRPDLEYAERIGETRDWEAFWTLANGIRRDMSLNHGLLRAGLHLRISGYRLIKVYQEITRRRHESFL